MAADSDTAAEKVSARLDESHRKLRVVIPTGGRGGQMYPMTSAMPKTLLPVRDKPVLVHILRGLDSTVFEKAYVLCDVWHNVIEHYLRAFESVGDIKVDFQCLKRDREERPPAALKELVEDLGDPFVLYYCDILLGRVDWKNIRDEYFKRKEEDGIIAMLLVSSSFQYSVGVVQMDSRGRIETFEQKPGSVFGGYANCAVALLSRKFVDDYVDPRHVDIFDHSLKKVLQRGTVAGYVVDAWDHLQQPRDWIEVQKRHYAHLRDYQS